MENLPTAPQQNEQRYFVTTRWSIIVASQHTEAEKAREAMAELCRIYWRPVFLYIGRKGSKAQDAEDLAQDFFMKILDADYLLKVDREQGKFRSFLLTSLRNFLTDSWHSSHTQKRGGGWEPLVLEGWDEEMWAPLALEASPERIFDLGWAMTISHRALTALHQECSRKGRERVYLELSPFLTSDIEAWDYSKAERALGMTNSAVRVLVSRLRERYRSLLRLEVAETVRDESQIGEELRYLYGLLSNAGETR